MVPEVLRMLDRGADIGALNFRGDTALHLSCSEGRRETALLLLDRGADIGARNIDGDTALHLACDKGHMKTAFSLLDRGADISLENNDKETPAEMILICVAPHDAVENNFDDFDDFVFDDRPVDETATEETRAALVRRRAMYLAWMRRKAFLAILSHYGCLSTSEQPPLALEEDYLVFKVFRVAHINIVAYI